MTSPLYSLPTAQRPNSGIVGQMKSFDGIPLRYARWEATQRKFKGTICIFPGRGEFIEKYYEVISELLERGFAVAILDWRGQGLSHRRLSNPRKGHVSSYSNYEKDLRSFIQDIVLPDCRPPYYGLAISMGGAIILDHARISANWFERIVLVSPMLRLRTHHGLGHKGLSFLARIGQWFGFSRSYVPFGSDYYLQNMKYDNNPLTCDRVRFIRNQDWVKRYPELCVGSPTIGWLRQATKLMNDFTKLEFAAEVNVPTLIIAAGKDKIVDTRMSLILGQRLRAGRCLIIPEAEHEILMERERIRKQFWAAFDEFIPGS